LILLFIATALSRTFRFRPAPKIREARRLSSASRCGYALIAASFATPPSSQALAETLGDARVGFSAERTLILDGQSFVGKMWHMPGEQRHEQDFPIVKAIFVLHADSAIGDVLLPQLHTVVEFALPKTFAALTHPDLGHPVAQANIEGIGTTEYALDEDTPDGHAHGSLWLSPDGIPMKCVGRFEASNGKASTIVWQLHHVRIGKQDATLFDIPRSYAKLPVEAAAPLLGLRLARPKAPAP
jgi:hypothetical protein